MTDKPDDPEDLRELTIEPLDEDPDWAAYLAKLETGEIAFPNVRFTDPEAKVTREYMPVPRCDMCRWWKSRSVQREEGFVGTGEGFGFCGLGDGSSDKFGSIYGDGVETAPDFGCVQFEPKEGQE